ncbi:hypothetical protein CIHG_02434 [Coccidioides immitis H538.4]|uniref:Uncharacterized protein n=1 Tax=Coccidioides immitis H538.4 TaxID=396776 RepID=A0A0J8UBX9_COCIT|nr:hypothetical protein CIHG_02434 [Coccidioides immitis H538.4]
MEERKISEWWPRAGGGQPANSVARPRGLARGQAASAGSAAQKREGKVGPRDGSGSPPPKPLRLPEAFWNLSGRVWAAGLLAIARWVFGGGGAGQEEPGGGGMHDLSPSLQSTESSMLLPGHQTDHALRFRLSKPISRLAAASMPPQLPPSLASNPKSFSTQSILNCITYHTLWDDNL